MRENYNQYWNFPRDCYNLWQSSGGQARDGLYLIRPGDSPIAVYCAVVDFDRGWDEYKHGFGSLSGNHWLGNEHLHWLTRDPARYKLGIKLEAQCRLRLGLFQGTVADALTLDTDNYLHDNKRFTTRDLDNDNYFQNCAQLQFQGVLVVRRVRCREPELQERHLLAEGLQQRAPEQIHLDDGETLRAAQSD
uniref:Zgc:194887 n=1 Tax=Sinocyclocheilus grahami TaxID=75366 RepID=A0A672K8I6_SINGR